MRAYEFQQKGGSLVAVKREIPVPGEDQVRIKVHACGICHSDLIAKHGALGGGFPRVPGHEYAGIVEEVGSRVTNLKKGDRVGVGWFGECCNSCRNCVTHKAYVNCSQLKPTGVRLDGGYQEYAIARASSCAKIPEELSFADAGPLMCAGVTTFNSLRQSRAQAGDVVVVVGLGGLGHLGVQFAAKMGFVTVASSRGSEKKELALKLGAHHYIDTSKQNVTEELVKLGGAKIVLWTATSPEGMQNYINGLDLWGEVLVVAAFHEKVSTDILPMLGKNSAIRGWASGDARDSEATLKFATLTGVRPMIEKFPFSKCNEALERMESTKAKFRVVLEGWDH